MKRETILINTLYCICAINVVALIVYAQISYFFTAWMWDASVLAVFPLWTYTRIAIALALLSVPMTILSALVYRHNNIRARKRRVLLGLAIWLPAVISLWIGFIAVLVILGNIAFDRADLRRESR